jgi:hypothetical protein
MRLINLAHQDIWAGVVVNPTDEELPLAFQSGVPKNVVWRTLTASNAKTVPARNWAWAQHQSLSQPSTLAT